MASDLDPEGQALDRTLLECSAEETAGVSGGVGAGGAPRELAPGDPHFPGLPALARVTAESAGRPPIRSCTVPWPPCHLFGEPTAFALFLLLCTLHEVPDTLAFALYTNTWKRGGKETSRCFQGSRPTLPFRVLLEYVEPSVPRPLKHAAHVPTLFLGLSKRYSTVPLFRAYKFFVFYFCTG